MRSLLIIVLSAFVISSCAKLNPDYPFVPNGYFSYTSEQIALRPVSSVIYENNHSIYFASTNGSVIYYDGIVWKNIADESDRSVNEILKTRDNILWKATNKELSYYQNNFWTNVLQNADVIDIEAEGISNLWILTSDTVNQLLHYNNQRIDTIKQANNLKRIAGIATDSDHKLWIASANNGLFYTIDGNEIIKFQNPYLPRIEFTSIATDENTVWLGDNEGVIYKVCNNEVYIIRTGLNQPITKLYATDDNSLWAIVSQTGLIRYKGSEIQLLSKQDYNFPSNNIITISQTDASSLLITFDNGEIFNLAF
ncbi:MAG: hypothetical protein PHP31_00625 [Lentimicrobiaceae bacterium]|nr:hypothetical protein [Lentimicrobiaceae bacterium]